MPEEAVRCKRGLSSFQIIILGFAGVILLGALLLMLPVSTTGGNVTPFNEALFTATSAVCVTGLIIQDTGSYWSTFGQAVILALIQIGGLGVVTIAASFALLSGRKISLMQRSTMQDAISAPKVGGIVRLTRFILRGTFLIELLGAFAMLPVFCRDHGWRGVWMAVFHSISAFCNAGFDILGTESNLYPSLTGYAGSPIINITIMLLIVTGGIGFLTWDDICEQAPLSPLSDAEQGDPCHDCVSSRPSGHIFLLCGFFFASHGKAAARLFFPVRYAEDCRFQHRDPLGYDRRIAGRYDLPDDDRRIARLHGGRYENNNAGCIGRKCCRDLSPA